MFKRTPFIPQYDRSVSRQSLVGGIQKRSYQSTGKLVWGLRAVQVVRFLVQKQVVQGST